MEVQTPDDGYLELDSHADVAVLGANCWIFQETSRSVQVYGYDPAQGSTQRKVVSGCFAYDDPQSGACKLLIVHQGLHVPTMANSLIPPFQMRDNDVEVNECPKTMKGRPTADDHTVIIQREGDTPYRIPLMLKGTISAIPVRRPTPAEFSDTNLERFELTYETPEWDHNDPERPTAEKAMTEATEYSEVQRAKTSTSLHPYDVTYIVTNTPEIGQ